jgi:hypothetical protein
MTPNETKQPYYLQAHIAKDVCLGCGDWKQIVEVRDARTHNVLAVGCENCMAREGWA